MYTIVYKNVNIHKRREGKQGGKMSRGYTDRGMEEPVETIEVSRVPVKHTKLLT